MDSAEQNEIRSSKMNVRGITNLLSANSRALKITGYSDVTYIDSCDSRFDYKKLREKQHRASAPIMHGLFREKLADRETPLAVRLHIIYRRILRNIP